MIRLFRFLVYGVVVFVRASTVVVLNLNRRPQDLEKSPVVRLYFCVDCHHPEFEGSSVIGLTPKHLQSTYSFTGEVVYCIPNLADKEIFINKHEFRDRIVFVDRGKVALIDKVRRLQAAGADGIIIADDGQCTETFEYCGLRIGSVNEGGFSAYDEPTQWSDIVIPVVMISLTSADRMRAVMDIRRVNVKRIGVQNMTTMLPRDSEKDL